jgi:hypothetical protein
MTWNYRVVRSKDDLRIYDVYYNEVGEPIARHEQPSYVYGDTIDDLKEHLELMLAALEDPILNDRDICKTSPTPPESVWRST